MNGSTEYKSSNAFRRAAETRLKTLAQEAETAGYEELRRRFVFERFLALVFDPRDGVDGAVPGQWVLKGGTGLLMRLSDARYSRDIDLVRIDAVDPRAAVEELRQLTAPRPGDLLTFTVDPKWKTAQAHQGIVVRATASIGATWAEFSIDLALETHAVAAPEHIRPDPVVDIPGLPPPPEFTIYSIADQIADKVGAMYEVHGEARWPSSRFRDLVDLALIISAVEFDATPLVAALQAQPEHRPALDRIPTEIVAPSPDWAAGYLAEARNSPLPGDLQSLQVALAHVGACLNPLLTGSRSVGVWRPGAGWS